MRVPPASVPFGARAALQIVDLDALQDMPQYGTELDEGRPVFYSWAPDSKQIVSCVSASRLSLYTIRGQVRAFASLSEPPRAAPNRRAPMP